MANTKKNQDEKVVLILGVVTGVALLVMSILGLTKLNSNFSTQSAPKKPLKDIAGKEQLDNAVKSQENPPQWDVTKLGDRTIPLVTSIPLFLIPGSPYLIDLYSEEGDPVHPPIENKWWLENKIDPSFKNSLKMDADGDGFSNLAEYEAKTDPTDFSDHPSLVSKLSVVGESSTKWKIFFSSDIGEDQYQFRYEDQLRNRMRSEYIGKNARFFNEEPVEGRFLLKSVDAKEMSRNGVNRKIKFATIVDVKKNTEFVINRGRVNDFIGKDYSVTFSLDALGKANETFTLLENTKFNLPDGDVSDKGQYHFIGVQNNSEALIQYKKGEEIQSLLLPLK